jgi:hypothetical protein
MTIDQINPIYHLLSEDQQIALIMQIRFRRRTVGRKEKKALKERPMKTSRKKERTNVTDKVFEIAKNLTPEQLAILMNKLKEA